MNIESTVDVDEEASGEDWAVQAANRILDDLKGRKGIGNEIDNVDVDVLQEITDALAEIIRGSRGAPQNAAQAEPEAKPSVDAQGRSKRRIENSIKVFSAASFVPMEAFELKDALVDLIEGALIRDATQVFVLAQPTGELEVRARIDRKVHTLHTSGNHDALGPLCATIAAAGRDRVPYLPSRPFESVITKTSIDQHGLHFPERLKSIHALIEPLNKGMFIDIRLHHDGSV